MIKLTDILKRSKLTEAKYVFSDDRGTKYSFAGLQKLFKRIYLNQGTPSDRYDAQAELNSLANYAKDLPTAVTTDNKTWKDFLKWQTEFKKTTKPPRGFAASGFDIGKQLFADPNDSHVQNINNYTKFLKQNSIENEPNTSDENEFLFMLARYIQYNDISGNMLKALNTLKKFKNKFPIILDPQKAKQIDEYVYRGMLIPLEILIKSRAKDMGDYIEFTGTFEIETPNKFSSFSLSRAQAVKFAKVKTGGGLFSSVANGEMSSIVLLPSDDPNLLINPDFLKNYASKGYGNEQETFYIGKGFTAEKIQVMKRDILITADFVRDEADDYTDAGSGRSGLLKNEHLQHFLGLFKKYIPADKRNYKNIKKGI